MLNWIDDIKLSHKSASKIRDHLDLDDRNFFKMKNPGMDDEVDWNRDVDWEKISNTQRMTNGTMNRRRPEYRTTQSQTNHWNLDTQPPGPGAHKSSSTKHSSG